MRTKPSSPRLQRGHPLASLHSRYYALAETSKYGVREDACGSYHGRLHLHTERPAGSVQYDPTISASPWGEALDLDSDNRTGVNGIEARHGPDLDAPAFTVSLAVWISGNGALVARRTANTGPWFLEYTNGDLRLWVQGNNLNTPVSLGQWYMVSAVYSNGVSQQLWVDGQLRAERQPSSVNLLSDNGLAIGSRWSVSGASNPRLAMVAFAPYNLNPALIAQLHADPFAMVRPTPSRRYVQRYVPPPPENLTAPTLQINPDGTWTGGLGTWSGNPTNYTWELRRAADDSVVDSGSTSDAGAVLTGSLFISGDYYLWVYAENSGGSLSAVSSTAVMQVGSQITFDAFRTSRRIMGDVRMGRRILGEVRVG